MTYQEALNYLNNAQVDMKSIESVCETSSFIETCKNAIEKQIPKKPFVDYYGDLDCMCPTCHRVFKKLRKGKMSAHCSCCGQSLDWSDE